MPKLTNLVRAGTLVWVKQGTTSFLSAEYRGKTVDGLHELEIIDADETRSGRLVAVPRREILITGECVLSD